ncbi:MAG: ABC transporter permease [bacterium]|nr:ABC transporter permease [Candidatus Minthenecus merdequi]
MRAELFIALRYLFAKKRHNTINMVTWVAVGGVVVGTMAMVCVMSVLNGFEKIIESSLTAFDPDIKISANEGTWIDRHDSVLVELRKELKNTTLWCPVVEQDGILALEKKQIPVKVKGVGANYGDVTDIDKILYSGNADFLSNYSEERVGLLGYTLAEKLYVSGNEYVELSLYVPKNRKVNISRPDASFAKKDIIRGGEFFSGHEEYDENYVILPLDMVVDAYQFDEEKVNSYEIKVVDGKKGEDSDEIDKEEVEEILKKRLAGRYKVQNRFEQQEDVYRMGMVEKWSTFMILSFIILIATFNIVSSLSMILIEKKEDMTLFRNLGAKGGMVRRIFTLQGCLITFFGTISGIFLGVVVVLLQEKFGFLKIGSELNFGTYPVELKALDIVVIFFVVMLLGVLSARFATRIKYR